jgi:hypothetical protein
MTTPGQKFVVGTMLVFVNILFLAATFVSEFLGLIRWFAVFSLILSAAVILQLSRL